MFESQECSPCSDLQLSSLIDSSRIPGKVTEIKGKVEGLASLTADGIFFCQNHRIIKAAR